MKTKIIIAALALALVGCEDVKPMRAASAAPYAPEVEVRYAELALELVHNRQDWAERCMKEDLVKPSTMNEQHRICIKTSATMFPDMITQQLIVEFGTKLYPAERELARRAESN